MKTQTLLSAYVACESRKSGSTRLRPKGLVGIAVNTDGWAREWQRLDRISYKCLYKVRARLVTADVLVVAAEKAENALDVFVNDPEVRYFSNSEIATGRVALRELQVALRRCRKVTDG